MLHTVKSLVLSVKIETVVSDSFETIHCITCFRNFIRLINVSAFLFFLPYIRIFGYRGKFLHFFLLSRHFVLFIIQEHNFLICFLKVQNYTKSDRKSKLKAVEKHSILSLKWFRSAKKKNGYYIFRE